MTLPTHPTGSMQERASNLGHALERESRRINTQGWGDVCKASSLCIRELLAHLLSQGAEIDRLQEQLDAGTEAGWHALRNERDDLKSRLAAADALLQKMLANGYFEADIREYLQSSDAKREAGES